MGLQLIGHYDSPYVRRVAVSLVALGLAFKRRPLSVFRHAHVVQTYNPLGRVPALILDDGEVLIDSAAILDHLDEAAGADAALLPARGKARREGLQLMGLATGANDKAMAIAYELRRAAADKIDEAWIARCRGQLEAALAEIERRLTRVQVDLLKHPGITIATMLGYVRLRVPEALPSPRHRGLEALAAMAEALPPYLACRPTLEEIGGEPEAARAALFRLASGAASR